MTDTDPCSVHGELACLDCAFSVGYSAPRPAPAKTSRRAIADSPRDAIAAALAGARPAAPFYAARGARPLRDRDGVVDAEAYAFDGYAARDSYAEEAAERAEIAAELAADAAYQASRAPAPAPLAMSMKQRSYLADLIRTRGDALHRELDLDDVDRYAASRLIDELRVRPSVARLSGSITLSGARTAATAAPAPPAAPAPAPLPAVADGRYAVELDGAVRFYRLRTHDVSGRQYLDAQASDDYHAVTRYETRLRVLSAIADDPDGAMRRYGVELGRCGNCGRTLTDETSRAYGIGPDCRAKLAGGRS